MYKKISYILAFALIGLNSINAQSKPDAEKILNDLLAIAKTSAIQTNFTLKTTVKSDPSSSGSNKGTFTLKASKFTLDMTQIKVWYNGKTQWTLNTKLNEVSVSEPTEKELAQTNPMAIISSYKNKSTIRFAKESSTANYIIELLPKDKKNDIAKVIVTINKSNKNLVSVKSIYSNGNTTLITLSKFEKNKDVADNTFTFNQARYKGVSINDLR